jgi:hypothetical protein
MRNDYSNGTGFTAGIVVGDFPAVLIQAEDGVFVSVNRVLQFHARSNGL